MIANAFFLGLSTGAFCFSFCAPVLMGLIFSRAGASLGLNLKSLGIFLSGRLIAYLLFSLVSTLLGEMLKGNRIFSLLFPGAEVLLGLMMILVCIKWSFPHWAACNRVLNRSQGIWRFDVWTFFSAGFLTGINICPPFLLAMGMAVQSGSVLNNLLFFFTFFLVTSLYFIPFLFSRVIVRTENIRRAARIVCGLTGGYYAFAGGRDLVRILVGSFPG